MKHHTRQFELQVIGTLLWLVGGSAMAAGVDINVNLPGAYPPRVYVPTQPVYVRPVPVYVQQNPVLVYEQPAYMDRDDRYWDCKKDKCKLKKAKKEKHHHKDHDE